MLTINQPVDEFTLPSTGEKQFSLSSNIGKNLIIYFYPKDDTPGCTTEGLDFKNNLDFFSNNNFTVLGISRDSVQSHENFKQKMGFPFELLSDESESVCKLFDVIRPKNVYGKTVLGIERSTFFIDKEGVLRKEWRGVKAANHVNDVIDYLKETL